ncbi:CZB domain-containing protein [Sulfurimonas sp. NWX79]
MKKEEIIEKLQKAKLSDLQWIDRVKNLIAGTKNDTGIPPVKAKESEFGKWFYNEGQKLKRLSNNPLECMKNIEVLHEQLHKKYLGIYHIYFAEEKKAGFFSKLLGAKRQELSEEEKNAVDNLLRSMENDAKEFVREVERLERRLEAVAQEKIDSVMKM